MLWCPGTSSARTETALTDDFRGFHHAKNKPKPLLYFSYKAILL
jgi:hypothetical protein